MTKTTVSLVETALKLEKIKILYNTHEIKSGYKKRIVNAPIPELKKALSAYNKIITALYASELKKRGLNDIAQAYLPGKSIRTNAAIHKNSPELIKFDFKGFYDCVRWEYYNKYLFRLEPEIEQHERIVKRLLIDPRTNGVIQGSPMSGTLAGLALIPFWEKLQQKIPQGWVFTQYSDDIVISSPNTSAMSNKHNLENWTNMIKESLKETNLEFFINDTKTCKQTKQFRRVTGITINPDNKPTPRREDYRFLRMILHQLKKGVPLNSILNKYNFEDNSVLRGKIAYWKNIDETGKIDKLLNEYKGVIQKI